MYIYNKNGSSFRLRTHVLGTYINAIGIGIFQLNITILVIASLLHLDDDSTRGTCYPMKILYATMLWWSATAGIPDTTLPLALTTSGVYKFAIPTLILAVDGV